MANLFGKQLSKSELLKKVGDVSQLCGIKTGRLQSGRSYGVELAKCWTGSGLEFEVNLSRGMGIGAFRYKGIPLAWVSPTGDVAPEYYDSIGGGMDRSYYGGLFHNSGLRQVGAPCEDSGEQLGLHGRISNLPADYVAQDGYWDGDEYTISLSGKVREVSALGENLVLSRKISSKMGSKEICIEDTVENCSPEETPHMILYHTNFGFPLVDEGTRFVIPSLSVISSDTGEDVDSAEYETFTGVQAPPAQKILFHKTAEKDDWSSYVIANDALGIGIQVSYYKKNLPELINWFDMETGRNVIEAGPSNCKCFGRAAEREAGTLQFMKSGEKREYKINFKVLDGAEEIENAVKEVTALKG